MLLRDILAQDDPQILATIALINQVVPDVLVLTDFDYDRDGFALAAFAAQLSGDYIAQYAAKPNTGMATGLDLDGNGYLGDARDAQGYGRFAGDGGMAILSRYPIGGVTDLSALLWRDLPDATLPPISDEIANIQRLSTAGHWIVPFSLPDGPLAVMAFSATPPVFDGPEDRNGLRNRDELRLWTDVLNGGYAPAPKHFVIVGNANLDPDAGDGLRAAMVDFLADPRLQDPLPGVKTADWPFSEGGPGALRVSYVLPAADWVVMDAGVVVPVPGDPLQGDDGFAAGPHRLVWVDVSR